MIDIGGPEFLLLVILGLLIFGPRRLPQIGRQLGGFIAQMRQAMREFQGTLDREIALEDLKEAAREVRDLQTQAGDAVRRFTHELTAPAETAPSETAPEAPASDDDASRQQQLPFGESGSSSTPGTPAG